MSGPARTPLKHRISHCRPNVQAYTRACIGAVARSKDLPRTAPVDRDKSRDSSAPEAGETVPRNEWRFHSRMLRGDPYWAIAALQNGTDVLSFPTF